MFKFWDKVNGFLDKHFEVIEQPTPALKEPSVRKFYKITVYTSHPGEEEYEYYSTAVPAAMYQYARNMLEDYIHCAAMEYYWRDGKKWETEEQFYNRFRKRCGYYIEEVSKKEYFDQVKAIWRME
jgi:hypothetical protein